MGLFFPPPCQLTECFSSNRVTQLGRSLGGPWKYTGPKNCNRMVFGWKYACDRTASDPSGLVMVSEALGWHVMSWRNTETSPSTAAHNRLVSGRVNHRRSMGPLPSLPEDSASLEIRNRSWPFFKLSYVSHDGLDRINLYIMQYIKCKFIQIKCYS